MVKFPTDTRMTRIDTHYLAIKIEKNKTIWTSQFAEALANGPPDLSWVGAAGKMLCFFLPQSLSCRSVSTTQAISYWTPYGAEHLIVRIYQAS